MRVYGGERIASIMGRLKVDEDTPLESRMISKSLEAAQKKVEGFNFDARKNVVQYDDVMNRQRRAIYTMRREILMQIDVSGRVKKLIEEEAESVAAHPEAPSANYETIVKEIFPFDEKTLDKIFDAEGDKFPDVLKAASLELYKK